MVAVAYGTFNRRLLSRPLNVTRQLIVTALKGICRQWNAPAFLALMKSLPVEGAAFEPQTTGGIQQKFRIALSIVFRMRQRRQGHVLRAPCGMLRDQAAQHSARAALQHDAVRFPQQLSDALGE